ncbi:hypothetical protein Acr_24g0004140 [Actinidia rufa]|uniref:Uncharacterized protein n=1 Tax=Actinidia rufa TaxID=165716 RepID=A0A7J0GUK2_9ERIC|nr:hypothetical protein Acr_24g0004140 [Actinidia rufa]
MGRVHGSRRDPRKDRILEDSGGDQSSQVFYPRPKARRRQHFGSGRAQMSTLMVALASSMERTWRGSMDSFYLGQEGSEIKFGVLNAMGLRRMNVRRCSVPLGAR